MNEEERRAWSRIVHAERDRARRLGLLVLVALVALEVAGLGLWLGWW